MVEELAGINAARARRKLPPTVALSTTLGVEKRQDTAIGRRPVLRFGAATAGLVDAGEPVTRHFEAVPVARLCTITGSCTKNPASAQKISSRQGRALSDHSIHFTFHSVEFNIRHKRNGAHGRNH